MSKAPIDIMLDNLQYTPVPPPENPSDLPYATHYGLLQIGDISLRVHVLNTGQRVINADDLELVFPGWKEMLKR